MCGFYAVVMVSGNEQESKVTIEAVVPKNNDFKYIENSFQKLPDLFQLINDVLESQVDSSHLLIKISKDLYENFVGEQDNTTKIDVLNSDPSKYKFEKLLAVIPADLPLEEILQDMEETEEE
eukprot:gene11381-4548_t